MLLHPDPHSQYGPGSGTAKWMRIYAIWNQKLTLLESVKGYSTPTKSDQTFMRNLQRFTWKIIKDLFKIRKSCSMFKELSWTWSKDYHNSDISERRILTKIYLKYDLTTKLEMLLLHLRKNNKEFWKSRLKEWRWPIRCFMSEFPLSKMLYW